MSCSSTSECASYRSRSRSLNPTTSLLTPHLLDVLLCLDSSRVYRQPGIFLHPVILPRLHGRLLEPCHALEDNTGAWVADGDPTQPRHLTDLRFNLLLCHERLLASIEAKRGGQRQGKGPMTEHELEDKALEALDSGMLSAELEG